MSVSMTPCHVLLQTFIFQLKNNFESGIVREEMLRLNASGVFPTLQIANRSWHHELQILPLQVTPHRNKKYKAERGLMESCCCRGGPDPPPL